MTLLPAAARGGGDDARKARAQPVFGDFTQLIKDSVAPQSWDTAGGKPGAMKEKDGQLTITQTKENQKRITELLSQVREGWDAATPRAARPHRMPGQVSADMSESRRTIRWRWLAVALALAVPVARFAWTRRAVPPADQPPTDLILESQPPGPDLVRRLDTRLPEVKLTGVSLAAALDLIRDASGVKMVVNWIAMRAEGVGRETPVSARLNNVRTFKALGVILNSVSSSSVKLRYWLGKDRVFVSTQTDYYARNTVVRAYEIRDIIEDSLEGTSNHPGLTRADSIQDLKRLIEDWVDSDTWMTSKPAYVPGWGRIDEFNGRLFIFQTRENHAQIEALLEQLREFDSRPPVGSARLGNPARAGRDRSLFTKAAASKSCAVRATCSNWAVRSERGYSVEKGTAIFADRLRRAAAALGSANADALLLTPGRTCSTSRASPTATPASGCSPWCSAATAPRPGSRRP